MVQRLSALLDDVPPGMAWDPSEVAKWWTADAREVFDESPEHERVLGGEPELARGASIAKGKLDRSEGIYQSDELSRTRFGVGRASGGW